MLQNFLFLLHKFPINVHQQPLVPFLSTDVFTRFKCHCSVAVIEMNQILTFIRYRVVRMRRAATDLLSNPEKVLCYHKFPPLDGSWQMECLVLAHPNPLAPPYVG
ncbi:hypothetical protein VNO78_01794 [Psophocarpus tetragonolobus]|uniref:Uncharacterized protein n=1 Tax=Psophocarpus tetragonolobus TaxID=3891 RepID=A0AAN9XUG1_PSOTE